MAASVLLVLAHPALHRSRANKALLAAAAAAPGVTVHDLYEAYPDYMIDAGAEQDLLSRYDAYVFQHPLYWYSPPALLKEWFDVVLTHGFAYGDHGRALEGKPWLTAVTAGGQDDSYRGGGHNRFTLQELLRPVEATAHLCRCAWQEPFTVTGARLLSEGGLAEAGGRYRALLEALHRAPAHAPNLPA